MATRHTWVSTDGDGLAAGSYDTALPPGTKAVGTLTVSTTILDGETCTIDGQAYRFKDTTTQAFDVKIAGTIAGTIDNLDLAIDADGVGDGSDYHAGTTQHTTVTATNTDTTLIAEARKYGTAGNALTTTEAMADASWEGATLSGATQWASDDEFVLGAGSHVAMITNLDWVTNFDPILQVFRMTKRHDNFSAIGSSGNPLKLRIAYVDGTMHLRGVGDVYVENHGWGATNTARLIIDGPLNVIVTQSNSIIGFSYVLVKAGVCDYYPRLPSASGVTGVAMTVGANAQLYLRSGFDGPDLAFAMHGRIDNERDMVNGQRCLVGLGTIVQTGLLKQTKPDNINVAGIFDYQPSSDTSGETITPIWAGGIVDFRESLYDIAVGFMILGPQVTFHEGPIDVATGYGATMDLRKEYP